MRARLNLADPRLRGIVSWWPLLGDTMCRHNPAPAGARPALNTVSAWTWGPIKAAGYGVTFNAGTIGSMSTMTATSIGFNGSRPRTLVVEYIHAGTIGGGSSYIWGCGTSGGLFGLLTNLYNDMMLNLWSAPDWSFQVRPNSGDHLVRLCLTYDGATTLKYYSRALSLTGATVGAWTEYSGSQTLSAALNTDAATGISLGTRFDSQFTAFNGICGSWVLALGDTAWTAEEAWRALRHPEQLWTSSPTAMSVAQILAILNVTMAARLGDDAAAGLAQALARTSGAAVLGDDVAAGLAQALTRAAGTVRLADDFAAGLIRGLGSARGAIGLQDDAAAGLARIIASAGGAARLDNDTAAWLAQTLGSIRFVTGLVRLGDDTAAGLARALGRSSGAVRLSDDAAAALARSVAASGGAARLTDDGAAGLTQAVMRAGGVVQLGNDTAGWRLLLVTVGTRVVAIARGPRTPAAGRPARTSAIPRTY